MRFHIKTCMREYMNISLFSLDYFLYSMCTITG